MRRIFGWMAMLMASGCALQGYGQVDSSGAMRNFELDRVIILAPKGPDFILRGGREWMPDSLSMANAQMGNLSDLFREMPSIATKRYAPGGLSTPSLRGTGAGHTQLYWEGLPLNSPMLGQQDVALGAGSLFESVVLRYGGNSLQEGSGGLGGSINLISKRNFPGYRFHDIRFREQFGSFRSNSTNLNVGVGGRTWSSDTKLYLLAARNNFPFHNLGLPQAPLQRMQNAGIFQWGGLQELRYVVGRQQLIGRLWLLQSDRSLPPTMLAQDAGEQQTDQAIRSMLQWNALLRRQARIETKAGWLRESMRYLNALAGIDAPSAFDRWIIQSDLDQYGLTRHVAFKGAGIRFFHDQAATQGYSGKVSQNFGSAYGKGEWRIRRQDYLTLLLREEWLDGKFSPLLGYLGAKVDLGPPGLSLNANIARNYRNPSLNDRYWVPGGNPNLRPERSQAAEVTLVFRTNPYRSKSGIYPRPTNLQAELGGYLNHVQDWILWVPVTGAIWQPENVQRVKAMGLEAIFKADGSLGQMGYSFSGNYTFSATTDADGHQLIYAPQHIASLRLAMKWKGWSLQYLQDWNSRRYTVADNSASIPGFTTGDLTFGWYHVLSKVGLEAAPEDIQVVSSFHPHIYSMQLQAGIRNIANVQYQTVAWRPMMGRSAFIRLDISLASLPYRR